MVSKRQAIGTAKKTIATSVAKAVGKTPQVRYTWTPEELVDVRHYAEQTCGGDINIASYQLGQLGLKQYLAGKAPPPVQVPTVPEGKEDLLWLRSVGASREHLHTLYASHRTKKKVSFDTLLNYLSANIAKGTVRFNRDSANLNCAVRVRAVRRKFEEENLAAEVDRAGVLSRLAEEAAKNYP